MTRPIIAVMTRAPHRAGKSRLLRSLGITPASSPIMAAVAVGLREALLRDTLEQVTDLGAEIAVLCTSTSAQPELCKLIRSSVLIGRQRGATLGQRMRAGVRDLLGAGFDGVVLVGSDVPTLPRAYVRRAIANLGASPGTLVLGPAIDGGYYLLAAAYVPEAALFRGIAWGTSRVLRQTLHAAAAVRTPVALLPQWTDVDSAVDLAGVCANGPKSAARHTRAWLAAAPLTVRRQLARAARGVVRP